jgi:16S rRNA G527 N7-methylase RsmG
MLPNDEQESERLDIHHALMLHLLNGKLYWAPISNTPQRVLDLGTGTGIWAIDFGNPSIKLFMPEERLTKLRYDNS